MIFGRSTQNTLMNKRKPQKPGLTGLVFEKIVKNCQKMGKNAENREKWSFSKSCSSKTSMVRGGFFYIISKIMHERTTTESLVTIARWFFFNCKVALHLKGSVERSLLPWAIFLIFTQNRPWKSEDHLCMLFFSEMSKERLEKSERTTPVSWRPWALAYSRDRPYNFSCLSALSKNGRFRSFFSDLGCHLASKSLSWPAMPVSNKKQEFEQRKRIKLFADFWVRAYRFNFAPRRRPRARSR